MGDWRPPDPWYAWPPPTTASPASHPLPPRFQHDLHQPYSHPAPWQPTPPPTLPNPCFPPVPYPAHTISCPAAFPPPTFPAHPAGDYHSPLPHPYAPHIDRELPINGHTSAAVESARWMASQAFSSPSSAAHASASPSHQSYQREAHGWQEPQRPAHAVNVSGADSGEGDDVPAGLVGAAQNPVAFGPVTPEVKPFIQKLYALLQDPRSYGDVITWSTEGDAFFVQHSERFLTSVLPATFSHANIHSFTRQLNVYGFTRYTVAQLRLALNNPTASASDYSGWSHPHFRRDGAASLHFLNPRPSRARLLRKLEKQYGGLKRDKGGGSSGALDRIDEDVL
ncbi:hypothetical protein JCM10213_006939 [Rhodosporidiobolus nylandii]